MGDAVNHFVGQLVRVNCPPSRRHGAQARVLRLFVNATGFVGHEVDIPLTFPLLGFTNCIFEPHELEPILLEGAAPSEFESLRDLLNELEGMPA